MKEVQNMKNIVWGINVIGPQGINALNDVSIGSNDDGNKVLVKIGNKYIGEDNIFGAMNPAELNAPGLVKLVSHIDDATEADLPALVALYNELIDGLKAAGMMEDRENEI